MPQQPKVKGLTTGSERQNMANKFLLLGVAAELVELSMIRISRTEIGTVRRTWSKALASSEQVKGILVQTLLLIGRPWIHRSIDP